MGMTVIGTICYGAVVDESDGAPWDGSDSTYDWWESIPNPDKRFAMVNAQSGDYPKWIVAIAVTKQNAYFGSPREIDLARLTVTEEQKASLTAFLAENNIKTKCVGWILSSYVSW